MVSRFVDVLDDRSGAVLRTYRISLPDVVSGCTQRAFEHQAIECARNDRLLPENKFEFLTAAPRVSTRALQRRTRGTTRR